jgi:Tfp pilus assembly protein PilV
MSLSQRLKSLWHSASPSTPKSGSLPTSPHDGVHRRALSRKPRGYLMLEVMISSALLATALAGALTMTRRASASMEEAARESQASQVLQEAIGIFLAHPFGTPMPAALATPNHNVLLGDTFRCRRTVTIATPPPEVVHTTVNLTYQEVTVTVRYFLANGGEREIVGTARRYDI